MEMGLVSIPDDLRVRAKMLAGANGTTMGQVIGRVLREHMTKKTCAAINFPPDARGRSRKKKVAKKVTKKTKR